MFLDLTWLRSILSFTSYDELIPSKVKNLLSLKIRSLQFVDLVAKRRSLFSSTTLGQDQPTQNFTKPPKKPRNPCLEIVARRVVKFIDLGWDGGWSGVSALRDCRSPERLLSPKLWWHSSSLVSPAPPQFRRESKLRPALIFPTAAVAVKLPLSKVILPKLSEHARGLLSPKLQ